MRCRNAAEGAAATFDLVIRGGRVYPGDAASVVADVGVRGGRIAAVEPSLGAPAARETVDARNLMVCPGFVDLHAHSALEPFRDPRLAPKVAQGFTTELINPDGLAPAPVDRARWRDRRAYLQALEGAGPPEWPWSSIPEYLDALQAAGAATTLVPSVGHNAVRDFVMGPVRRPPTPPELAEMRRQVRIGLESGARAVSFGLIYMPGAFAATDELAALAEEAARYAVPIVPHVRNEGVGVLEAVGEMIDVARRSGAALHLSHLKVIGRPDLVEPLLASLDRARLEIDVTFDQYPYGAGSTLLAALLPPWAQEGGPQATLARLRDPGSRAAIARDVARGLPGWENIYGACGPAAIIVSHAAAPRTADIGLSLAAIAERRGRDPWDAVIELLSDTGLDATMIDHYASEETVRAIVRHPLHLVGSDGIFGGRPHPRLYGTAARVLGRYALRERLIPADEAVARLAARAADRIGLSDRGRIRPGLRADLVVLDPAAYVDVATYEDPTRPPAGVVGVWVAGQPVWRRNAPTGSLPGGVAREARPIGEGA
jgi:N-acyl-D-amino-acid deacylase